MWGLQIGPWDALWLFAEMHTDQIPQLAVESSSGKLFPQAGLAFCMGLCVDRGRSAGDLSSHSTHTVTRTPGGKFIPLPSLLF